MNTRAFQLNHRRLRFQSLRHLLYAFTAALMVNVVAVVVLSALITPGEEPEPAKRMYQIQQQEPIKQPQHQQREKAKQEAVDKVLPPVPAMAPAAVQTEFTFPGVVQTQLNDAAWHANMDVGSLDFGSQAVTLDQRARPKYLPNLDRFYPARAKQRGITGYTLLELNIDTEGNVSGFSIIESEPAGVFDEQISKVVPYFRYEPAQVNGQPHEDTRKFKLIWGIKK